MCRDAFFADFQPMQHDDDLTVTTKYVNRQVDYTNAWYGARNQPRSHIYYTNGRVDPWSELAVVDGLSWADGQLTGPECELEWIQDGSHCSDMYMSWTVNAETRARQLEALREWLE